MEVMLEAEAVGTLEPEAVGTLEPEAVGTLEPEAVGTLEPEVVGESTAEVVGESTAEVVGESTAEVAAMARVAAVVTLPDRGIPKSFFVDFIRVFIPSTLAIQEVVVAIMEAMVARGRVPGRADRGQPVVAVADQVTLVTLDKTPRPTLSLALNRPILNPAKGSAQR